MGFGSITIGHLTLREIWNAQEGSGRRLDVVGQEASPPLTSAQLVARHNNLMALTGIVPVTFSQKTNLNGFYEIDGVSADLLNFDNAVYTSDWQLTMHRFGTESEVEIESVLTGSPRTNDHTLTGQRWHAPSTGHYAYYTGSTEPSSVSRTGEGGAVTVYLNIPTTVAPRWGVAPGDYYGGAVKVSDSDGTHVGIDHDLDASDWTLSNGLVRVGPDATNPGRLNVEHYDGGWQSKVWFVSVNGAAIDTAWDAASLLLNTPEECIVRLVRSSSAGLGQVTLDLSLRRGSRSIHGYMQRHASATLKVQRATAEAGTSGTGYVRATSNDANGNRYVVGSARSFTADTANGGLSKASTTTLDFFIGLEHDGSTAVAGDTAADLMTQYLGTPAESARIIRR